MNSQSSDYIMTNPLEYFLKEFLDIFPECKDTYGRKEYNISVLF